MRNASKAQSVEHSSINFKSLIFCPRFFDRNLQFIFTGLLDISKMQIQILYLIFFMRKTYEQGRHKQMCKLCKGVSTRGMLLNFKDQFSISNINCVILVSVKFNFFRNVYTVHQFRETVSKPLIE